MNATHQVLEQDDHGVAIGTQPQWYAGHGQLKRIILSQTADDTAHQVSRIHIGHEPVPAEELLALACKRFESRAQGGAFLRDHCFERVPLRRIHVGIRRKILGGSAQIGQRASQIL